MKIAGFATLLLAALMLGGCDAGVDSGDDATAANFINPYPPGMASPIFFRSASDWQPYADRKSTQTRQHD